MAADHGQGKNNQQNGGPALRAHQARNQSQEIASPEPSDFTYPGKKITSIININFKNPHKIQSQGQAITCNSLIIQILRN